MNEPKSPMPEPRPLSPEALRRMSANARGTLIGAKMADNETPKVSNGGGAFV